MSQFLFLFFQIKEFTQKKKRKKKDICEFGLKHMCLKALDFWPLFFFFFSFSRELQSQSWWLWRGPALKNREEGSQLKTGHRM